MKRLLLVSIIACALAVPSVSLAQNSIVAHAARFSCGVIHPPGGALRVEVVRGRMTCRYARSVMYAFFDGKGTLHGGPSSYQQYWQVGRWRCGHGAGGGGCTSGGTNYRNARQYITAATF